MGCASLITIGIYSCTGDVKYYDKTESSNEQSISEDENVCRYEDGTHSASVTYNNPETGYNQTYTLDVEVEDCEVIKIDFPNGGWLDSDHITSESLDDDGTCTLDGENGKTYQIKIDD